MIYQAFQAHSDWLWPLRQISQHTLPWLNEPHSKVWHPQWADVLKPLFELQSAVDAEGEAGDFVPRGPLRSTASRSNDQRGASQTSEAPLWKHPRP